MSVDDIVWRLRRPRTMSEAVSVDHLLEYRADMMSLAADEIERLRSALYETDEGCKYLHLYDKAHEARKLRE